jgi:glutamyl-Q tRNA(Asp) synthetase
VRIEDVDTPRCVPGADEVILGQLAICGLLPDEVPVYQSRRGDAYAEALALLTRLGLTYACGCTRRAIEEAMVQMGILHERFEERVYPGTCRQGLHGKSARATRVLTVCGGIEAVIHWIDRRLGRQQQNVAREVGDFVVHRADGLWAYQLAVVVDDGACGVDQVVRGGDLLSVAATQAWLAERLGLPVPTYAHVPLAVNVDGHRLAKRDGAVTLADLAPLGWTPRRVLSLLASSLGLAEPGEPVVATDLLERLDPAALPPASWTVRPGQLGSGAS